MDREELEEERRRLELIGEEIQRRENGLIERTGKLEYDLALAAARKSELDANHDTEEEQSESLDPAELRLKYEELRRRTKLAEEKEHHLVELQKNVLRRETETLNQKAKLDVCQETVQAREKALRLEGEDIRNKLKRKAKKLAELESSLAQREADVNAKQQDSVGLKDDFSAKSTAKIIISWDRAETS